MRERPQRRKTGTSPAGTSRTSAAHRPELVTLARALSKLGHSSRSQARSLVSSGRVSVDGRVERDPDRWINLRSAAIRLDGRVIRKKRNVYIAMHKPAGYVTTRSDERSRATVYELLGEVRDWVFPVGRLDRETSGLLLFTNDTAFGEALMNPESHVPKVYRVDLDRPLANEDVRRLESGLRLDDGTRLRPAKVAPASGAEGAFELTIHEGKNRQVRRMCESLGYEVRGLHRLSIGSLQLGTLAEGKTRAITRTERDALRSPRGEVR